MSPGLKARCTTIHNSLPHTNKTLNKPRVTHPGDHKQLKHTLNTTQSLRSKQKPFKTRPLKPQDLNPCTQASKPIVDPQGLNLCRSRETRNQINPVRQAKGFEPLPLAEMRTLKRALIRPQGLNLCHL